jgi:hypothetical protein
MVHPIFMAVLRRPELLFRHLANYGELVKGELSSVADSLMIRAASAVVAIVALLLAIGLTGTALMLGFLHGSYHWVLAVVPGAAWVLGLVGVLVAMRSTVKEKVDDVKDELEADVRTLRLIKEAIND